MTRHYKTFNSNYVQNNFLYDCRFNFQKNGPVVKMSFAQKMLSIGTFLNTVNVGRHSRGKKKTKHFMHKLWFVLNAAWCEKFERKLLCFNLMIAYISGA